MQATQVVWNGASMNAAAENTFTLAFSRYKFSFSWVNTYGGKTGQKHCV